MSTPYYKKVRRHLSDNCPVMKRIVARVGPCKLAPKSADPFTALVRCVISQQISTKAAASISGKLVALVNDGTTDGPILPAKLATLTEADYKACGISGAKQRAFRGIIDHVTAHPDLLPNIAALEDAVVREHLVSIKGIGPWTADMFLLFAMQRPDVWAIGDYGLKVALKTHFNLRALPDAKKMTRIAKPWAPYRSVASWYLWRSLEPQYRDTEE